MDGDFILSEWVSPMQWKVKETEPPYASPGWIGPQGWKVNLMKSFPDSLRGISSPVEVELHFAISALSACSFSESYGFSIRRSECRLKRGTTPRNRSGSCSSRKVGAPTTRATSFLLTCDQHG